MNTSTSRRTSSVRTRGRLSRSAALVLAGGLVSGAAFAAATGISSASTTATTSTAEVAPMPAGYGSGSGDTWAGTGRTWGGPGDMRGGPGDMRGGPASASSGLAEHFLVASTNPAGPGAIIVTGVFDEGGIEHPGRAVDGAVFSDGTFRIDHSAGHPTARFNPTTCVGTITQTGPFRVYDGTGRFSGIQGSGTYRFYATYTTARNAAGCTKIMTAYIETIHGAITVSAPVARDITSRS
jgi:hypothetical protein